MGRERKCILCEMVCSSKQEMDDHMRTMLHHRELEKLMGRDCGHECGVCGVTVAGLTEYAGHISSPQHKHNVEAADSAAAGSGPDAADTEYFDQALVDLIEKRNQLIRKDEEAAVARRARDEAERRRQQAFQQRLREAKERFTLNLRGRLPPRGGSTHPGSRGAEDRGSWTHGRQGKSATWHAQEPAGPRGCAAGEAPGGGLGGWKGYGGDTAAQPLGGGAPRGRHPWLSNRGSSNGLYGRNTIPLHPLPSRPLNLAPLCHGGASPPSLLSRPQLCGPDRGPGGCRDWAGSGESHHGPPDDAGPKSHGSTAKPDKACRWSPYPPTKSLEKDTPPPGGARTRYPDAAVPRQHETAAGAGRVKRNRPGSNSRKKNRGGAGSGGGSTQQEAAPDGQVSSPGPSKPPADARQPDRSDKKSSLTAKGPGKTSSRDKKWPEPESKSGTSRGLPVGPLQSRQEQQISELLNKSKEAALERRGSAGEAPSGRRKEAAPPALPSTEEEQQQGGPESRVGANKENNCSQTDTQDPLPELVRPSPCSVEEVASCPDFSQCLQSVHVSTSSSALESSAPSAPGQEDQELGRSKERGGIGEDGSCAEVMEEEEEVRRSLQEQGSGLDMSDEATAGEMSQGSENEASRANEAPQNPQAPVAPGLTRLGLPPVLTKHMGSKGKPGSHEPNLNIARRVRNVSESRRGDAEKESGLKPTVRQLISSSGSRRNVNWEQVYQEVRKKQGQGKGWPRFGIEMVSYDHEEQAQEEDQDMALLEGFHWDSLLDPVTPRKRSLSESSVAPGRPASSHGLFSCQASVDPLDPLEPLDPLDTGETGPLQTAPPGPEEQDPGEDRVFSGPGAGPARGTLESRRPADREAAAGPTGAGGGKKGRGRGLQRAESAVEVCGSGAELLDAQAMGKKRRAAGDITSPEIHSLKKNKRMKIKSKKERFQVDQLLAVSLREEELSLSLQTLDTNLIQARAALQAAYMEVQHIMVLKQQVATEMGTLRNQRIELLKGMQGGAGDAAAQPQVKHEKREADSPTSLPPAAATAGKVIHPLPLPLPPSRPASPPASPPPPPPTVKQEPLSPVRVSSPDPGSRGNWVTALHSCMPDTPASLTAALLDTVKLSPDRGLAADQINPPPPRPLTSPAHRRDSPPAGSLRLDRAIQVDHETSALDCKPPLDPSLSRRRTSETGPHLSPASSEMKSGLAVKRVRKLRKRRVLNKAQGAEPAPATSDTEADEDASAAPRKLRPRRRSSAGSLVSTSRPPTAPDDEEQEEVEVEVEAETEEKVEESVEEEKAGSGAATPAAGGEEEIDSALEMVNLESSEPEECMEVTMACQPPSPGSGPGLGLGLGPDPSRVELLNMACNEVTSTSNMDTSPGGRPDQSEAQTPVPCIKDIKDIKAKTSDVSSDPGEDEPPTEGSFEGHQEAVNGLQIHKGLLYTCSGDRTVKAFDLVSHQCVAVFQGHRSKVNCVLVSTTVGLTHRLYSGSSDQTVRCYSLRTRLLEVQFFLPDRVLCLHSRWKVLYTGLANGTVATFNLKTNKPMEVFECHGPRAVSCLSSSQEGARKVLLVGSYDSTISVRDARNGLLLRTLGGHTKTVLCMKVVNDLVFSGSSDQSVHAHNIHTGELVRVYKGHSHAVTVVAILGKVMLTASLDKLVRVYDLQSHDRLQVYGGHKDMVMCMTVHKSMIYTGCYDGSVQAVKLNLLQNYRCMWHGCSLVFGVLEHLQQHLADAHADPAFQTLRCRWRNCEEFFGARNGSKQGILTHMQNHAEELVKTDP